MEADRQFWVGVGFAAACVLFLLMAFKHTGPLTRMHYVIIQFVCALCAGSGGVFISGSALLDMAYTSPGWKFAFQGTAGAAFFGLVFLVFSKLIKPETIAPTAPLPPPPASPPQTPGKPQVVIAPGTHTTFHQIAETLAEQAGASIDLTQLTKAERSIVPRSEDLLCGTLVEAKRSLSRLASLVPPGAIRPYSVKLKGTHFTLSVK